MIHDGMPDSDAGFTLIEVMIAMAIMATLGIIAWRGMDAMLRSKENIESRAKQDSVYFNLVRQFERDCQEMIPSSEINIQQYTAGMKNVWWLRRNLETSQTSWIIVGYGITQTGLRRWISAPLVSKAEALEKWKSISRDPDIVTNAMKVSLEIPHISSQQVNIITNPPMPGKSPENSLLAGLSIRWDLKNTSFPISRSCLAGSSL